MISNRLAFGAVAIACVLAAGVGGYVATRQNPPVEAAATAMAPTDPAATTPEAAQPADTPATPAPETVTPAAAETAPERAEPVRRAAPADPPRRENARASAVAPTRAPEPEPELQSAPLPEPVVPEEPPLVAEVPEITSPEPPAPPTPIFEELVVPTDSVIGLQNETPLSSDFAQVEDRVEARVTRDVRVRGSVAIPAGSRALGSVTDVQRGGKFKERARLSVRFHTLVLADGTRVPISTDTIFREGDAPNGTAKVGGGAVAGAILGAIIGGAKGAAVGATAGAGAGTAAAAAGGSSTAEFPVGTPMTVRLLSPVTVTVER